MSRRRRFRSPERRRGFYAAYLDELIERNRRNGKHIPDVADQAYWDERRRNDELKDQPKAA
jgi:hypothetical protein